MQAKALARLRQPKNGRNLPASFHNFPRNLHLLGGPFKQVLQAARQPVLNRRGLARLLSVHRRALPAAAKGRPKEVIPEHPVHSTREPRSAPNTTTAASHATEGAGVAEELRKNVVGAPGIEAERGGPISSGGEEGGAASGVASARRRDLALKALLAVLVIDGALLGVAQDLTQTRQDRITEEED